MWLCHQQVANHHAHNFILNKKPHSFSTVLGFSCSHVVFFLFLVFSKIKITVSNRTCSRAPFFNSLFSIEWHPGMVFYHGRPGLNPVRTFLVLFFLILFVFKVPYAAVCSKRSVR